MEGAAGARVEGTDRLRWLGAMLLGAWRVAPITLFGGARASRAKVMAVEGRRAQEAERRHAG